MKIRGRQETSIEVVVSEDYGDVELRTYGPPGPSLSKFDWCALTPTQARKVARALEQMADKVDGAP